MAVDAFSKLIFDQVFPYALYALMGTFGLVLTASLLILLGVVSSHVFDIFACKTSVHIGWACYGVIYFLMLALAYLFFAIGGLSYNFCQYYS